MIFFSGMFSIAGKNIMMGNFQNFEILARGHVVIFPNLGVCKYIDICSLADWSVAAREIRSF